MKLRRTMLTLFILTTLGILLLSSCKSTPEVVTTPEIVEETTRAEPVRPVNTPRPTNTPAAAPLHIIVDTPTPPPTPTSVPTATPDVESLDEESELQESEVTPTPTKSSEAVITSRPFPGVPRIIASNALDIVPNVDPGPPLSVEVSSNDLLEGYVHRISGILRNESDKTYTGLGVIATFFQNNEMRYGPVDANVKCLLLAPGATCPFILYATSKNLSGVILHVKGYDTPRTPLAPDYWGVNYWTDSIGYVHITGTVHNQYTINARHVTIVGNLVNAQGDIVSVNAVILLDKLAPNQTAPFEIHLKYAPFTSINIVTQAEP